MWLYGIFIVIAMVDRCLSKLDLYVDSDDVKQLLGVSSQLWYVHNGTVNKYALGYVVVVPPQVDTLTFRWQALEGWTMPYNLSVQIANREALSSPVLNISEQGLVPTQLSSWTVRMICTGKLTTQVDVSITLEVPMTTSLSELTTLTILRKKICLRVCRCFADSEIGANGISVEVVEARHSTTVVYITLGCLAVFLVVVAALATFNHIRNNKARPNTRRRGVENNRASVGGRNQSLPNNQRGGAGTSGGKNSQSSLSELRRSPQPTNTTTATTTTTTGSPEPQYTDPRQGDVSAKLTGLRVPHETLQLLEIEQEGTFGRVYHALYQPPDKPHPTSVTVKTVTESSSEIQRSVLLSEGIMLAGLAHDQLLAVIGAVVTPPESPPCIIFPRSSQGNLKRFLQGCHTLVTKEVVSVGLQVLQALSYLHSRLLLHKDVATRNCVVDDNLTVKLTDCALARDLYPADYHCLGDNENRPIKWLALESLTHKVFTPAADVWSWGVLLWEVMTLGQQPYGEIDPFEISAVLRQGVRLAQPINCPDELFQAMTFCWTAAPRERPSVDELIMYLTNFQQHLDRYV
ncbi:tyrosine-protein kinase RYK-like isoform X1 [Palaemon carinicauda]|uniref:tyrosine-protein kinase RYK-like isoform X1 n=1 Tax=Palaemon carinicauda TaxID=392227 RepID=UPI0035B5AB88